MGSLLSLVNATLTELGVSSVSDVTSVTLNKAQSEAINAVNQAIRILHYDYLNEHVQKMFQLSLTASKCVYNLKHQIGGQPMIVTKIVTPEGKVAPIYIDEFLEENSGYIYIRDVAFKLGDSLSVTIPFDSGDVKDTMVMKLIENFGTGGSISIVDEQTHSFTINQTITDLPYARESSLYPYTSIGTDLVVGTLAGAITGEGILSVYWRKSTQPTADYPTDVTQLHNDLILYPVPKTTGKVITIKYLTTPKTLSINTHRSPFDDIYDRAITYKAAELVDFSVYNNQDRMNIHAVKFEREVMSLGIKEFVVKGATPIRKVIFGSQTGLR